MNYRTLLVNLDLESPMEPLMDAAIDLARRLDTTLIGLCAADAEFPILAGDLSAAAVEVWQSERDEIEERMRQRRAEFERLTAGVPNAEWRQAMDFPTRVLAHLSRTADLIIMRAAQGADTRDAPRSAAPSSVVLQAGRPVLVLGQASKRVALDKAVIAWKDTREARRAVADAVPLLAAATDVTLVTVEKTSEEWVRNAITDVAGFLARHGISARTEVLEAADELGRLDQFIQSSGADLIVSGAYGHSRLREWAFGGVTRFLLDRTDLCRFLSN